MWGNLDVFRTAVGAVEPGRLVREALLVGKSGQLSVRGVPVPSPGRVAVAAVGKASVGMAQGAVQRLGPRLSGGVVSCPPGSVGAELRRELESAGLAVREGAAGNLPDEASEAAAREVEALAEGLGEGDVLLVLLSGGGSALLPAPVPGLSLAQKRQATKALAAAGADIRELNTLRTHLSRLKGGRLAQRAFPAASVALVCSDVLLGSSAAESLPFVASGPTVEPTTTPQDALRVMAKYGLSEKLPEVSSLLGNAKVEPWSEELRRRVRNVVVGSNEVAMEAAAAFLREKGAAALVLSRSVTGEASEVGRSLAQLLVWLLGGEGDCPRSGLVPDPGLLAKAKERGQTTCLLWGSETTVELGSESGGRGGRNQELVLAAAVGLAEARLGEVEEGEWELSALGSDGQDGPNDAAGATLTHGLLRALRSDPAALAHAKDALRTHDSYSFWAHFAGGHGHFKPGLTGTNVSDFIILRFDAK